MTAQYRVNGLIGYKAYASCLWGGNHTAESAGCRRKTRPKDYNDSLQRANDQVDCEISIKLTRSAATLPAAAAAADPSDSNYETATTIA